MESNLKKTKSNLEKILFNQKDNCVFSPSFDPTGIFQHGFARSKNVFKTRTTPDAVYLLFDNSDVILKETIMNLKCFNHPGTTPIEKCYQNMIESLLEHIYNFNGEIIPKEDV